MLKELKYFLYLLVIFLFIFFTVKYYFSDQNEKNYFRSINSVNDKIIKYSLKLPLLKNDTDEVIARCWNGGPKGYKRNSTVDYWNKVNRLLKLRK